MKANVLVTGGAGFIGSHLCERLLNDGYRIVCVDNLSSGSLSNVEHLRENKKFEFIDSDITSSLDVSGKIDFIFNLASLASPIFYQRLPIETLLASSVGMRNVLELARKNSARILQASTSEVYGDPLKHPQRENYWGNVNPVGLRSCYDESKRFAEALCVAYLREHGVDVRIARIFNTYGPKMRLDDGRVIPNFIHQALKGKPITIYGDGSQTRSFCYVSDMIDGLNSLMFKNALAGEVVNLGNPGEFTVLELAEKIKEITGSNSKLVFKQLPEDDPVRRKPDISKAKKLLGWVPKIPLEAGLKNTIHYFNSI
jgi:nucleoside-diphosphate-sugar epimerase